MQAKKIVIYTLLFLCFSCKNTKEKNPEFIIPAPLSVEKIQTKGFLDISTFYSTTDYYVYKGITRGFHYELAQDFAHFLGVKLRVLEVNNDIDTAISRLRQGKYDLLAVSVTETPERKEKIKFAQPFFKTGEVLVQHKKKGIKKIEELDGKTIFIKKDAPYKKLLSQLQDSLHIHIKISEVTGYSTEDLLHLVEIGEIGFTITDENIASALSISMKNLDYSIQLSNGISISWATNPENNILTQEINEWLKEVKKNGKLNFLYKRYFNNRNSVPHHTSKYVLLKKSDLSPFDRELKKESKMLEWDWRLLAAIVYNESKFDPEAISQIGAYGLMQITPETATMFHVEDYFTPDSNIYVGVRYLKYLDQTFSKYPLPPEEKLKFVLASYNVGAGHVMDAMRLARKYEKDPYKWDQNVAYYLKYKSEPKYYRDSLSRNGYCNGQQAYDYVHRILETYNNYKYINP